MRNPSAAALVVMGLMITAACGTSTATGDPAPSTSGRVTTAAPASGSARPASSASASSSGPSADAQDPFADPLPGMPPVVGRDVYSRTRAGMLSPAVAHDPAMLYVPDAKGSTVTVISQTTRKVVEVLKVGYLSQHVVPSYDLSRLLVNSSQANRLTSIDPVTTHTVKDLPVPRPYNLYFTPDGRSAVVMVEEHNTIEFADPQTFKPTTRIQEPTCKGPNHADFSANGRFFVVTCEFSGELLKISTTEHRIVDRMKLDPTASARDAAPSDMGMSMPQDVRLSPDGRTFYVADMGTNELRLIDALTFRQVRTIGMPKHPHGLYPSRDGKLLYISDRGAGKVSVLDFATHAIVDTWTIPGGGSPDMGGVSADGRTLWLSGRYDGVVYGFDTATGTLVARIKSGYVNPHGLCVWPQPGRYSLGHTGNMR
ncbi:YncE family protein [Aestuariimicrobium kwangyangense]|uniref:YncE family protein n=1 Tax=Aestuariimicrobium kwangyangense TaxID=396389 RepID=UPI0004205254|nr:YncE family protein [Aestuariimicrobium kwangyangense]